MLDIVKISWKNAHDYWIPAAWLIVLSTDGEPEIKSRAMIGRPTLRAINILDRVTIPGALRSTGQTRSLMSRVILYGGDTDNASAAEFLARMEATYV